VSFQIDDGIFSYTWKCLATLLVFAAGLAGCASISHDVDRYYRQMAQNFRDAEIKAKADAEILEGKSRVVVQAGDLHRYSSIQKELARLKDWQAHCAKQRERFEKAAEKLEEKDGSHKKPVMESKEASPL
jgi:uncharacterized OsmC-like protein